MMESERRSRQRIVITTSDGMRRPGFSQRECLAEGLQAVGIESRQEIEGKVLSSIYDDVVLNLCRDTSQIYPLDPACPIWRILRPPTDPVVYLSTSASYVHQGLYYSKTGLKLVKGTTLHVEVGVAYTGYAYSAPYLPDSVDCSQGGEVREWQSGWLRLLCRREVLYLRSRGCQQVLNDGSPWKALRTLNAAY
ncbi:hypothetical protein CIB48_g1731 [Xylaria polymorpha]|nr:hypothetical protein CIB48_g1731 [Xylaria polymorpha]